MPWLAAIGGVLLTEAFVGTAVGGFTAMVIGGAIVGAAIGAIYTAVEGGSLGTNMLYGALGGAVVGAGAYALGYGTGATIATAAGDGQAAIGAATAASEGTTAAVAATAAAAPAGAALFSPGTTATIGAVASLGSAFLNGSSDIDYDAQIASNEKIAAASRASAEKMSSERVGATIEAANISAASTTESIKSNEELAGNELEFSKDKFGQEFAELQYIDRTDRSEAEAARLRQKEGVLSAAKYVTGTAESVSLVKSNKNRRELPSPVWYGEGTPAADPVAQTAPAETVTQVQTPTGVPA